MIGRTVISSGMTVPAGSPRITPPTPEYGSSMQFGDAGDWP
jgi:hypothetical protein